MNTFNLTDEEISHAANLLSRLEAGYLPQRLFDEINRLHVTSTVVVVPLKRIDDRLSVLLVKREPHDPVWPNFWHLPGTMLRPNDKEGDYSDAFHRIFDGELKGVPTAGNPTFTKTAFTETRRGRELTQVYFVEVVGEPTEGKFFPVDELPHPIIEHETHYIREVAQKSGL